jgi:GMP synthase (glutamine-hydrolysing)
MEMIIVVDFGSQYTGLIARRVRELNVYCEVVPWNAVSMTWNIKSCAGYILSGGPAHVLDTDVPSLPFALLTSGLPILGICYGMQYLVVAFGGRISTSTKREYGAAELFVIDDSTLFKGLPATLNVWMSHGDSVEQLPPNFTSLAKTGDSTITAMVDHSQRLFGVQFHPEVTHTVLGKEILRNFLYRICGCHGIWTPAEIGVESVATIRSHVGSERAICAVSGGVDSTVAAILTHKAIGDQMICIFVDHGLLRQDEAIHTISKLRSVLKTRLIAIDARQSFIEALAGIIDPEQKRRIIGELFIRTFEAYADKLGNIPFLIQGTLYSDVIESAQPLDADTKPSLAARIKSHHNVGGLPSDMRFKLVEPLRNLFKDEVRQLAHWLGLPDEIVWCHPFPGPGLAIRCLGEITPERLRTLQLADTILIQELKSTGLYRETAMAFVVLLPIKSGRVIGNTYRYEQVMAVRVVTSEDLMTAEWARLPYNLLARVSSRITSEIPNVSRVVFDITSKPPATIDWE